MLHRVEISHFGSIRENVHLELGQLTLIRGGNGSGKSMILQALAAALTPGDRLPGMWCRDRENRAHVHLELTHPNLGELTIDRFFRVRRKGDAFLESTLRVNGTERSDASFLQTAIELIFFAASENPHASDRARLQMSNNEFLQYCSRKLGYDGHFRGDPLRHIEAILERINRRADRMFERLTLRNGVIRFKKWDNDMEFSYPGAGGGDLVHLFSDFALEASELLAQHKSVLILLDAFPTVLAPINSFARRYRSLSVPEVQVLTNTWRSDVAEALQPDCVIDIALGEKGGTCVERIRRSSRPELVAIEETIRGFVSGQEDEFIESFVLPALHLLGFHGAQASPRHGPGEMGFDIGLCRREILPGRIAYFGAQVKVGVVHARSGRSGSVNELIDQIHKILDTQTVDPYTQTRIRADYAIAIVSNHLNAEAKRLWEDTFVDNRRVLLWDAPTLARRVYEAGIWPRLRVRLRPCVRGGAELANRPMEADAKTGRGS